MAKEVLIKYLKANGLKVPFNTKVKDKSMRIGQTHYSATIALVSEYNITLKTRSLLAVIY